MNNEYTYRLRQVHNKYFCELIRLWNKRILCELLYRRTIVINILIKEKALAFFVEYTKE